MTAEQPTLWGALPSNENPAYLKSQIVTYIGNKRSLLSPIGDAVELVKEQTGLDKLRIFDCFSGSGIVSRFFKQHASSLVVNDIESYARVISECYLSNLEHIPLDSLSAEVARLNELVEEPANNAGFIERTYAPLDDDDIKPNERVFYTRENARRLDRFRQLIDESDPELRPLLLGPLLVEASIHANTSGVFKGFHKDPTTGIGKFGGGGADAISRIKGRIDLKVPVLSRFNVPYTVLQADAIEAASQTGSVDLTYLDPPYNQHPYGSNYFMLNLLVDYIEPRDVSRVSGIPVGWQRSDYNVRRLAWDRLTGLVAALDSTFVLISFNDEGFVDLPAFEVFLASLGPVKAVQKKHNTFRGSRNLGNRSTHVTEHLFLLERR
jgi:adenine-specific DNA-methyltransferase